jgi:hypothetical protein
MSCPICLSEVVNPVFLTKCRHSACFDCVLRWSAVEVKEHGRPYPRCFICRQTYDYTLTLYGDEVQRLNSFNGVTIPVGISPLEYAQNGFFHMKLIATAFEYWNISNAVVCFDCGYLHFPEGSNEISYLKTAHLYNFPNCPTACVNIMGLDLI